MKCLGVYDPLLWLIMLYDGVRCMIIYHGLSWIFMIDHGL